MAIPDEVMTVETMSGNVYSYSHISNEIFVGEHTGKRTEWRFSPLASFCDMPNVNFFIISITEQCNLRCSYCCYSGAYKSKRVHNKRHLVVSDIDEIYDFINSFTTKRPIRLAFYGGEPLLHWDFIKYSVLKGKQMFGDEIIFSVSTNGTILSHQLTEWLVRENIEMAISIDGIGSYHDRCRRDVLGHGTFNRIRESIKYIKDNHPEYMSKLSLLMTLSSFKDIAKIAETWHDDEVFSDIAPTNIHGLSPNFEIGVSIAEYDDMRNRYIQMLDVYEAHREFKVLKVYLDECISYWKDRPIFEVDENVPMPTCIPLNTKLYIDADKKISVCEKMPDCIRIGDTKSGIDWKAVNSLAKQYYDIRKKRCGYCPAVRMCDMCLTALEFDIKQWDLLCKNERTYAKAAFFLFCEMVERGLVT